MLLEFSSHTKDLTPKKIQKGTQAMFAKVAILGGKALSMKYPYLAAPRHGWFQDRSWTPLIRLTWSFNVQKS